MTASEQGTHFVNDCILIRERSFINGGGTGGVYEKCKRYMRRSTNYFYPIGGSMKFSNFPRFQPGNPTPWEYTQFQKKCSCSSVQLFSSYVGRGGFLILNNLSKWCITPYSVVYTFLQKKGNFKKVVFLLRPSVHDQSLRGGELYSLRTDTKHMFQLLLAV